MGKITWRERLAISPHLRSLNNWPVIDQNSLPAGKRQLFHQRRSIVAQVLVDMCVTNAAERHAMSPSAVSRIMNRALGGQEDQPPALTYALVPYHRLSSLAGALMRSTGCCLTPQRCGRRLTEPLPKIFEWIEMHNVSRRRLFTNYSSTTSTK